MSKKHCSSCKREKELSAFHKNRSTMDGLNHECKECRSLRAKRNAVKARLHRKRRRRAHEAMLGDGNKLCKRCGQVKPLADFPNSKRIKSGKGSLCKACVYRRQRKWDAERSSTAEERRMGAPKMLMCSACSQKKPKGSFYADSTSATGYMRRCKKCQLAARSEYAKAYRRQNRAHRTRYLAQWKANHPTEHRALVSRQLAKTKHRYNTDDDFRETVLARGRKYTRQTVKELHSTYILQALYCKFPNLDLEYRRLLVPWQQLLMAVRRDLRRAKNG